MTIAPDRRVADSVPTSWVDRAPTAIRPYLRLARYDRPVGFWLLAIPCWQGLALASVSTGLDWMDLYWAILFGIGAIAMRGAGCTYNDIVDRDIDAQVARTADRPLAAGTVSLKQAWAFLVAQCLVGLLVLIQLPWPAILTGLGALALVAGYPFMKRITWWPQAWLGLTFNWGVPVAGAAALGTPFAPEIMLLYVANLFWTLGYDTIYACQDMEDDAMVGVKSSARALGGNIPLGVLVFYLACAALAALAGVFAGAGLMFAPAFAIFAAHLLLQARKLDPSDGAECLRRFKANQITGLLLTGAFLLGAL
ncbi:MAG: 4-hydroxybenzoate octaprenyltransferase [Oceanicaulis sp.]|jgi:4-hydroxybenzoate polyprenyltransferase|uniref:4-hydroxybenzoate octaprenyltransferase n=1 Tax=unclassified Oceanicaulis TaxID=2632123 RepID=UPI000C3DD458|nr:MULTISPECIES: 4-hydroxybenzoate octaprenyltransferase [unclassified Oceanicaulis]MAB70085.1 4-hydroxybenzoate octaprenyltransferase [Oceanicaulis sp.]MBC39529.1 4-hydroxybenzoate octaprenyltransferase [Oceanicaulis sp.]MBG35824.1 4-hydroxybenzoate octaprenyltransferase [Oceanicaulis sp.]HBU62233.1 4-hydroxybenzoate octaprenyltransferase [Oceanicaulis sp.]HCR93861.1 4-hydroxybenzoate octaprenyltransferase [Oceanicaulis sp.]|tara:strand:+ start:2436 stop:3362 length:927 start_codon:yes stop_codon:yes gene_type:complete